MTAVLVGIMFILSGCGAYYSDSFDFEFNGKYMADKYVDLLIPLDETDEFYTDSDCKIKAWQEYKGNLIIEIPENNEIVNYNKDGFRSMLMHIKEAYLHISTDDSENKIIQRLGVPYYEGRHRDPYNEEMFLEFCNKYKKCRVAIFDKDGNILQISKKIPLVSLGNFYLQNISYDVEENKIKPYYKMTKEISFFIIVVWLFSLIGTIGCIITLIADKVNRNKFIVSYKGYIIATSIFNIPTALFIIIYIYCAFGMSLTIADFFLNFLTIINIYTIGIIINIGVLVHFIRLEKKLRIKKYHAESLDISEKM